VEWCEAFLDLGLRYYSRAARRRVGTRHAVESFLKAELVTVETPLALSRKPYGHDLTTLWNRYKAEHKDPVLVRFDTTVAALGPFWSMGYPDDLVRQGFQIAIDWRQGDAPAGPSTLPPR
jgi:hypothetical protein